MANLPVTLLPASLRNHARGNRHLTAAVELLIAHGAWLHQLGFVDECVDHSTDLDGGPVVWIDWELVTGYLEDAACSSSEARVLSIAAELAGVDTGRPLADLLDGLDDRTTAMVLTAIAIHNGLTPPVPLIAAQTVHVVDAGAGTDFDPATVAVLTNGAGS